MHNIVGVLRTVAALLRYLGWAYDKVREKAADESVYPFTALFEPHTEQGQGPAEVNSRAGGATASFGQGRTRSRSQEYADLRHQHQQERHQQRSQHCPSRQQRQEDIALRSLGACRPSERLLAGDLADSRANITPNGNYVSPSAAARSRPSLPPRHRAAHERRERATMACCAKKRVLMVMTTLCACSAFAFLCIAVATDYWLFAVERFQDANGTSAYTKTYTGLWRKCVLDGQRVKKGYICSYINYFTRVEKEDLDVTNSILASMQRSTLFPLISLLILLIGEIVCFLGHCNHKKKVLTFVAGILFVVGGLCTLIGIIIYIGAITEEVGNKPKNTMDEPRFTYYYGASFILTVTSFIVSELTGVLSVYLYISRHKTTYRKKQERMTMIDANEHQTHNKYRRSRSHERSREHSRDNSPSHSDTYYTYTPVSDTSKDMSNYSMPRDPSRHTISTSAETHLSKEHSIHSVRELDTFRRTTPV